MEEVWKMAEELSPEGKEILAKKRPVSSLSVIAWRRADISMQVSLEQTLQERDAALAARAHDDSLWAAQRVWVIEYDWSVRHRGDNTLANAKEQGALIAKDLYPDVNTRSLREYAKSFYAAPKDIFP
jgi:hypothetical protein